MRKMDPMDSAGISELLMYTNPSVRAASRSAFAHSSVFSSVITGIGEEDMVERSYVLETELGKVELCSLP